MQCRRDRGAFFFPVTLEEVKGDEVRVRYGDDDEEWTLIAALRLPVDDEGPGAEQVDFGRGMASPKKLQAGDRVWAPWQADVLFPAIIVLRADTGEVHVRFADGSEAWVGDNQIMPLDIPVGLRVLCDRERDRTWKPATVLEVDGMQVQIRYDHGAIAWVNQSGLALPTIAAGPNAIPINVQSETSGSGGRWWLSGPVIALVLMAVIRGCLAHH